MPDPVDYVSLHIPFAAQQHPNHDSWIVTARGNPTHGGRQNPIHDNTPLTIDGSLSQVLVCIFMEQAVAEWCAATLNAIVKHAVERDEDDSADFLAELLALRAKLCAGTGT